jgi:eukaryotic-like serine/threonine-protein kinase
LIGSVVSHYQVLERLGGGGMGVVYKAQDLKLERFVALKFLAAQRGQSEEDVRRFTREARAASLLDHPNICTVYEIGETADGRLFIAMAFCEGESLKAKIERGPLKLHGAVDIAAQVAAGLARAHEKGIVHRDVKPANIMVAADGQVKIVDFGIAKLADQSRLTRAGAAIGTASYMAPELFLGEPVEPRADLWSLGVVLYEMVAGRAPFDDAGNEELIHAILHGEPAPLASLRPGVPEALERIVRRALAKQPADRQASGDELRAELLALAGDLGESEWRPTAVAIPWAAHSGSREVARGLIGRTVSHYRILESLGGGGMGVVYKAEDAALGRTVALKFLPAELTRDPEAKARFLQEARAASALDHPNLCTIHEVGETAEGQLFLVMTYYDGETLRKRIERGPLPIEQAVDIAQQIARGLQKAHRHGIVHRDVKPANLMVTGDEVVKILDFGLAKLVGSAAITRTGFSAGTPAYMSPEQARGETVDHRTDLWSLGVVLYEMVAGRRPFRGEHEQAAIYSLLHDRPEPLGRLRPETPPELERIVSRLLAKDPAERYADAAQALADLRLLDGSSSGLTQTRSFRRGLPGAGRRSPWLAAAAALVVVAALVGGALLLKPSGAAPPPAPTFSRLTDEAGRETYPSLSPDGEYFVYTKRVGGNGDVYQQRVGGGNAVDLTRDSPSDDTQPAYSPDGQQIAFRSERDGGGIFLMGATGESVRRLTDFGYNPAWSPDGREIVVATESIADPRRRSSISELWRVEVASGARRRIAAGDAVQPSWSPGGRRIAFWGLPPRSSKRIVWTIPAAGGEAVAVTDDDALNWNPVWSPEGRFLYFVSDKDGSMHLWRAPVDERSGKVLDSAEPVTTPSESSSLPSFSRDGKRIAYATADGRTNLERIAFDPGAGRVSGELQPVTQGSRVVRFGDVSPDGNWVVFDTETPQEDLYLVRPDGSGLRQLTNDPAKDRVPRWSPDGSRILFYSNRGGGKYMLWTVRPDGSGQELVAPIPELYSPLWSPDGRRLACGFGFAAEVLLDLTRPPGERVPQRLPPIRDDASFGAESWSPDGARLAGTAQLKGGSSLPGVVAFSFATNGYERLTDRGGAPVWLHDSRRLLYLDEGKVFLLDSRSHQSRQLLAPPPNSTFLRVTVAPGDRFLYLVRASDEGDVWLRRSL